MDQANISEPTRDVCLEPLSSLQFRVLDEASSLSTPSALESLASHSTYHSYGKATVLHRHCPYRILLDPPRGFLVSGVTWASISLHRGEDELIPHVAPGVAPGIPSSRAPPVGSGGGPSVESSLSPRLPGEPRLTSENEQIQGGKPTRVLTQPHKE